MVDHEGELAFALIIGSFRHKGADSYTEHYVALTYADKSGNLFTAHAFPDPDSVTISADRSVLLSLQQVACSTTTTTVILLLHQRVLILDTAFSLYYV